jgi:uncharacterized membrane protein
MIQYDFGRTLSDGLKAKEKREERLKRGEISEDDYQKEI